MTHQPKHSNQGRYREVNWTAHTTAKKKVCVACKGSRLCQTCQGVGCQTCDYVGKCVYCLTWAKDDAEDEE